MSIAFRIETGKSYFLSRALFVIDKKGIISYIDVHDINQRPPLEDLAKALERTKYSPGFLSGLLFSEIRFHEITPVTRYPMMRQIRVSA